ncbi:hypothetical protein FRC07_010433, partial [Ceratobasidium sp. 392]
VKNAGDDAQPIAGCSDKPLKSEGFENRASAPPPERAITGSQLDQAISRSSQLPGK